MFPAAEVNGDAAPGGSQGTAMGTMERLAAQVLPPGMHIEWTDIAYQAKLAGNTAAFIFPLCVLFVFLVHSAEYESWSLALAIVLIAPMCLPFALFGTWLRGLDNNLITQIGFITLIGLAAKNAVLIVEFAKQQQEEGRDRFAAAVEASRLRLRPILMTSFAFILGVLPLARATGPGAEMRQALGTAVFSGMLGVTLFGLFLTPVFYVLLRRSAAARVGARRASPRPDRYRTRRHVSAGELSGRGGPRAHRGARHPGEPDLQLLPRDLQPRLGDRRLGPHPARYGGRARRLPRRRGGAAWRAPHPGERRGASVLRAARARPRARDHAAYEDHVPGHRRPHPAAICRSNG